MVTSASQNLRRKFDVIMKRWEERAREEVASAYGTTSLSMRDALPKHLEQLAEALASSGQKSTKEIARTTMHDEDIGKEHGRDRAHASDYSIDEVILEYRILRQVTIQVLEEEHPLSGTEREIITDLIEQAVNDAASEFSAAMREMRDQYTATLTHDLRGPITAAQASAQMILRRSDNLDLCVNNAARIMDSLRRLNSMVENLLDAGRIRSGESLSVTASECNPNAIASEILDEMITIHGERFTLSANTERKTFWDCGLYRRALENLVTNAVKYGDPKGAINISLTLSDASLKVAVHNEGNPIPEKEKVILFQRYRRSRTAQESSTKGWGLGLTLVSGVMQAHGGSIAVESSKDKGTTFTMVLPIDCRKAGSHAS